MATTFDRGTAATFATAAPADQKGTDLNNTILHIRYIVAIVHICNIISLSLTPGVDRWQLLTTHTSKSLCEPDMRISMFNCDVSQTLFVINSAAVSLKMISPTYASVIIFFFHSESLKGKI